MGNFQRANVKGVQKVGMGDGVREGAAQRHVDIR